MLDRNQRIPYLPTTVESLPSIARIIAPLHLDLPTRDPREIPIGGFNIPGGKQSPPSSPSSDFRRRKISNIHSQTTLAPTKIERPGYSVLALVALFLVLFVFLYAAGFLGAFL